MELTEIDLLSRDVFADGVPYEWFRHLRREAPVFRHPEPYGPGFWVLTRHADVVALNRDWQANSSEQHLGGVVPVEDPPAERKAQQEAFSDVARMMLSMDPPDHTRYRKLVNRGFTPKMINALEPHLRQLTGAILDRALEAPTCDFVVDVAAELPLQVIAELLGVPQDDRHRIFEWSNRMIGSEDPEYVVTEAQLIEAFLQMYMYATQLSDQRRAEPRDDIVTTLITTEVDGDTLSPADFNQFFLLLAVAGNETTRNAISHGIHAFLQNPDQYALLGRDPGLIPSAVEEILRWSSPVMYFRRNVTRDYELHGQTIRAGDKVSLWYTSANRDEEVFEEADRFDVRRDPNPHVAFGGGGPHFCLGSSLARMEIRVLLEELVARGVGMEAAGPPVRLRSSFINGIKHLPVAFRSGAGAS